MNRLSSSSTIILALFLPVFWLVFFGSIGAALWLTAADDLMSNYANYIRIIYSTLFILFGFIIYFFFYRLRRVEYLGDRIFVTNYFKTLEIPLPLLESVTQKRIFNLMIVRINLSKKGYFGKKITTLSDVSKYNEFLSWYLSNKHT
jgi:hypothetical protein